MVKIILIFVATISIVFASEFNRYFVTKEQNLSDFEEYSHSVAKMIKNLTVSSARDKFELGVMGYELVNKIHDSIFYFYKAHLNIEIETFRYKLDYLIRKLSAIAGEVQEKLHGFDSVEIVDRIVFTVDRILEVCRNVLQIVQQEKHRLTPPVFGPFQVGVHRVLFVTQQLKYQAYFFHKSNKQITIEVDKAYMEFSKALTLTSSSSDEAQKELVYQIWQLEHIVDKHLLKLETWVQFNKGKNENITTVTEVSEQLSGLYAKLHHLVITPNLSVMYIKSHFALIYDDFTKAILKLDEMDAEKSTGTQEYIRPVLINSVAISKLYTSELNHLNK